MIRDSLIILLLMKFNFLKYFVMNLKLNFVSEIYLYYIEYIKGVIILTKIITI